MISGDLAQGARSSIVRAGRSSSFGLPVLYDGGGMAELAENKRAEGKRVRPAQQRLDEVFLVLLREKPVSHATVTEICRRARVNRSTYYVYFDNPLDQLDRLESRVIEGLTSQVDRLDLDAGFSRERLSAIVEATVSYIADHADVFRILLGEHGSMAFERRMLTAIGSRALSPRRHDDPESRAHLLQCIYSISGTFALIYYWLTVGSELDRDAIVQTIVRMNADVIEGMSQSR